MADSPISGLPASDPLDGTEELASVQAGITKKTTALKVAESSFIKSEPTIAPFTATSEKYIYCNSGFNGTVTIPNTGTEIIIACDLTSTVTDVLSGVGVQGDTTVASGTSRVWFFTTTDGWRQK